MVGIAFVYYLKLERVCQPGQVTETQRYRPVLAEQKVSNQNHDDLFPHRPFDHLQNHLCNPMQSLSNEAL
jgi:hypothetical protein